MDLRAARRALTVAARDAAVGLLDPQIAQQVFKHPQPSFPFPHPELVQSTQVIIPPAPRTGHDPAPEHPLIDRPGATKMDRRSGFSLTSVENLDQSGGSCCGPTQPAKRQTKAFMTSSELRPASASDSNSSLSSTRARRHERWFKRAIVCATLLAIVVPFVALPRGRYLVAERRFASSQGRPDGTSSAGAAIRNRPGLAAVPASRDRRLAPPFERDLRVDRPGLSRPHALRRARSRSWTAALGQLRSDASAALDCLRARRRGPLVSDAALH